jgi:TonB family protein
MGAALRRMRPAQFVLDHRAELALTPEQVPFLESLGLAQADSERVRTRRRSAALAGQAKGSGPLITPDMMSWAGPIDEDAIRAVTRQQAEQSAELQIQMAHDRHAVGAVLTPTQIAALRQLEANDLMGGIRAMGLARTPTSPDNLYFEFQVDKQAVLIPGAGGLKYPDALRAQNVGGEVLTQFVVDSTGTPEAASFKILRTSNSLFTQAVRDALPLMHFTPAERAGVKVRQLVQMPFTFTPGMK